MRYSKETKEQVLKEIEDVGNITLVCKKHNLKRTTVHGWLDKINNASKIADKKATRVLEKKIKDQEHEIEILRALLKKTYPLWNNEKSLS